MKALLDTWKAGKIPKVGMKCVSSRDFFVEIVGVIFKAGPQTEQIGCEGPLGKTSLFSQPPLVCRDLDKLKVLVVRLYVQFNFCDRALRAASCTC